MKLKCPWLNLKFSPNANVLEHLHCVICLISSIVVCIFGIDLSIVNFWLYSACLVFVIDTLFFVCNCQTLFPFFPIILLTDPAWLLPHDSWYYLFVDPLHFQQGSNRYCFFSGWLYLWSFTFLGILFCVWWFPK